ncbi:MAG: HDOD domain-containing protein [Gammaproteobacteria bacterium]|nr:HDOD domain-containing protein [Gammaproteobacteria bacterium]
MAADISQYVYPKASGKCLTALQMLSEKDTDINTLEKAISGDDLLSHAIIKYSNSPVHHRAVDIEEVSPAINLLGLKNIYNVLVMAVLKEYVTDNMTGSRILQHSATIAALTSLIGAHYNKQLQHEVELLGILHDLPSLVLCYNHKAEYRSLMKEVTSAGQPLEKMEQDIFGVNRTQLIKSAVSDLHVPANLVQCINSYHSISRPDEVLEDDHLAILALAHHMEASVANQNLRLYDSVPGEKDALLKKLAISDTKYSELINASRDVISEHISLVA